MEEYVWVAKLAHHPVFHRAHRVLGRLGAQYGVKITISGPDAAAPEPYLQALRDAARRRAAGIMVIGWDVPGAFDAVDAAIDQGIPVVTVDSDMPRSKRLAHVGTDWFRMGWAIADKLAELIAYRGKVLMIGIRSAANMQSGFRGFRERMRDYPEIEVLGPEDDLDFRFDKAQAVVDRCLETHPDLVGVAGFDSNSGPGAALALERLGKGSTVKLVCVDADKPQLEHLRTGAIDAALSQKREAFTYLAFQMLYTYNHGSLATGNHPGLINIPGNIATGHVMVTLENIDSFEGELSLDEALERHQLGQQFALLSSMVRNIAEIALATDVSGQIVYANPAATTLCGYSEAQMKELSIEQLFSLTEEHRALVLDCAREGQAASFETSARRNDGETFPVQLSLAPLEGERKIRGMAAVAIDLTGRKRTEEALAHSEHSLRLVLEHSFDGINVCTFDLDSRKRRLVMCNDRYVEISGRSREELMAADNLNDLVRRVEVPPDSFERICNGLPARGMSSWIRPDDKENYYEWTAAPIYINGKLHIIGIDRDITERRQVEEERLRLVAVVEQTEEAIVIMDTRGTIEYVNPAFETMTGYSRDEAVGSDIRMLQREQPDGEHLQEMWNILAEGQAYAGRFTNRSKDGTVYHTEGSISPLRDAGGTVTKYVAVERDITQQSNLEAQLLQAQKMEAVGRLAGGIAHDFNNQLTVIKGYCDLLLRELSQDNPMYGELQEIHRASARAESLTNQLLAFSRKQILSPQVICLNDVLRDMVGPLKRIIGEDIQLKLVPAPDLCNVEVDPMQVQQAIMNLTVNARDAMPAGGELTFETSNETLDADYVRQHVDAKIGPHVMFSVSDTGVGMGEEVSREIFEPFFTTKPMGEGTGLGLAMVYGFVKQSGGHITLSSEPGWGTKFRIYLPCSQAKLKTPPPPAPAQVRQKGTETILVAEDDESVRELIVKVLRREGYTVLDDPTASTETRIREADLLVTDVIMPEMSGPELANKLRQTHPKLPVLYITGYADRPAIHRKIGSANERVLTKPFPPNKLGELVRSLLDEAQKVGK